MIEKFNSQFTSVLLPLLALIVMLFAQVVFFGGLTHAQAAREACLGAGGTAYTPPRTGADGVTIPGSCTGPTGTVALTGSNSIFERVINILTFIVGAVSVIMLIIGGLRYVLSNGDANAITSAKNTILYAIVGIIVAFAARAVVLFIIGRL
jgi:hypothetical protein